jgi:hypothetical protein
LAGDTLTRVTSQAFNNAGAFQGSIVRYNQIATGNVTTTSAGTRHNFQATPTVSVVIKNIANIDAAGLTLTSFANSGLANTGITFQDGSYQNTAYIPTNTVTSITAATGIATTAATGNITITNTGVITAQGTANQIAVNGSYANTASGNIVLTLPQDISASSNPTFNNITAGNITVLGNLTYSNVDTLDSYRLYLANTSTNYSQINGGGIILGNVANGNYWRSILYDQGADAWSVQGNYGAGNLIAGNVYSQASNVASQVIRNALHIGQAAEILDYSNALVQADTDTLGYAQIVFQNHGNAGNASTDYVAVNNIGNDTQNYIDFGINSSTYANTDYAVTGANDGYLYINGGNLAIGTQSPANVINFFTGGTNAATNIRAVLSDTDLAMKNANVLVQDGNDNSIIELRTDGNIVFNGSSTLNLTGGFHVSSVTTNAGDANIVNYVGGAFVYGPALKDYAGNLRANNISAIGSVTAQGNITGAYVLGNGSALTGVIHALGNAFGTVSANGVSLVANTSATTLTLTPGNNISILGTALTNTAVVAVADAPTFTGNVTANYFVGNGSRLTSLTGANVTGSVAQANYANTVNSVAGANVGGQVSNALVAGTVYTAAQPNITTVGTLTVVNTSGNISATGNVTAAYHIGNGSLLTSLTGANVTGSVANATYAVSAGTATTATTAGTVTTNAQPNITSVGILSSVSVTGLVTGGQFSGNGNTLSNIQGANVSGQVGNALIAGTVYTNAQPNITTVGTLTVVNTSGNISATGNVTAAYHIGNGSLLTSLTGANVTGTVANATYAVTSGSATTAGTVTTNAQPNITSVGTLTSVTSNGVVNFVNTSNVSLGAIGNVHITGGAANNVVITNGSGNLSFTSLSSVIGVGGNQLVYVLNAQQTIGSAKNTLLSLFGLTNGVALASNTRYQYEILFNAQCSKAGTLSYALALSGGAVIAQHNYNVISNKTTAIDNYTAGITMMSQNATGAAITTAQTVADTATFTHTIIQGTIDVTTGGNVNFMVSQDQNTPVTWTINAGSYVKLLPLGAIGSNTVDGTWS